MILLPYHVVPIFKKSGKIWLLVLNIYRYLNNVWFSYTTQAVKAPGQHLEKPITSIGPVCKYARYQRLRQKSCSKALSSILRIYRHWEIWEQELQQMRWRVKRVTNMMTPAKQLSLQERHYWVSFWYKNKDICENAFTWKCTSSEEIRQYLCQTIFF